MATYIVGQIDGRHSPETQGKDPAPTEHRCANCYGPYGLSAIPCPNAPGAIRARRPCHTRTDQPRREGKLMGEAFEAALAARRAERNPNRCNPNTEFQLGWEAAIESIKPKPPEPERTFEELMQDDRIRYTAARDSDGGIRLSRGMGALVANATDTRANVQMWFDRAGGPKRAATYKAALNLMDAEATR